MTSLPRPKRRQTSVRTKPFAISLADLRRYAEDWQIEGQSRGLSAASLNNRRMTTERFLWFLEHECQEPAANKKTISAFLEYLQADPGEKQERWGKRTRGGKAEHGGKNQSGTVLTYFTRLQGFFNFCVREGHLPQSPMQSMKPPVHREDDIQPFSREQVQALLLAANASIQPKRNRAILLIMFDTGLRAAEVCSIKRNDIGFGKNLTSISVLGKGNKRRSVYLKHKATEALRKYLVEAQPEDTNPLFFAWSETQSRSALTPGGLLQLYHRLGTKAKIEGVRCSPHTMRHTYATEFLRNGGDVLALQQFLGHTDLKQTRKYVQIVQADLEAQHQKASPADNMRRK